MSTRLIQAQLLYKSLGWNFFPVCHPSHKSVQPYHKRICRSPGKRPLCNWKEWKPRIWTYKSNIGVSLGRESGIVAIDIDGDQGVDLLERYDDYWDNFPLQFITSRNSFRLIFVYSSKIRNTSIRQNGREVIKFMTDGTMTVMPPSDHVNGGQYAWLHKANTTEKEIRDRLVEVPETILKMLRDHTKKNLKQEPKLISKSRADFIALARMRINAMPLYRGEVDTIKPSKWQSKSQLDSRSKKKQLWW